MDHEDNEIWELIKAGPTYKKSGKEFIQVIRYLFENPKVQHSIALEHRSQICQNW